MLENLEGNTLPYLVKWPEMHAIYSLREIKWHFGGHGFNESKTTYQVDFHLVLFSLHLYMIILIKEIREGGSSLL